MGDLRTLLNLNCVAPEADEEVAEANESLPTVTYFPALTE